MQAFGFPEIGLVPWEQDGERAFRVVELRGVSTDLN